MKTLYIGDNGIVTFDPETQEVSGIASQRESIRRILLAEEPMHVVSEQSNSRDEFDVKKDDLIITFWDGNFEKKAVVAKSKDWVKNLKTYNKIQQKALENWAKKASESADECAESESIN